MLSDVVVEGGGGEKQGQSRCSVMWCGGWRWRETRLVKMLSDVVWRVEVERNKVSQDAQ